MNEWVTIKTFSDRNEAMSKLSQLNSRGICAKLHEDEMARGIKLQVMDDSVRNLEILELI